MDRYDDDWHHRLREERAAQAASQVSFFGCTDSDRTTSEQRDDGIQVAARGGAEVVQQRVASRWCAAA